jgi:hypothetical protein
MAWWPPRQVEGGEWVGQHQPPLDDDYVPPLPDNPPPRVPSHVAHRRQDRSIRLALAIAFLGMAVLTILLFTGVL